MSELERSGQRPRLFQDFTQWEAAGMAWLRRKGVQDGREQDLVQQVWLHVEGHLERGGLVDRPRGFFWTILARLFSKWCDEHNEFVQTEEGAPDSLDSGSNTAADARHDCQVILDAYGEIREPEARAIRLLVVKHCWDLDAAAHELARHEGFDPMEWETVRRIKNGVDAVARRQIVDRFKRRISAYLARFLAWARKNFE